MTSGDMDIPFYNGITQAETGSFSNPWIRTTAKNTPGGSTAFGPAQLTYSTAKDFAYRQKSLSPESLEFFKEKLEPMYLNFKKYGNAAPKDKKQFDYGGTGDFDPVVDGPKYNQLTHEIMASMIEKNGGSMEKAVIAWRGKKESQDPRYYQTTYSGMNE